MIRTTAISVVSIVLLIGSTVGTAAQDEAVAPSEFSGTVALSGEPCQQEAEDVSLGHYSQSRYAGCVIGTISGMTSDTRLEGDLIARSTVNHLRRGAQGISIQTSWREIRNDAGVWREIPRVSATIGIEPQYRTAMGPGEQFERVVLVGEGGYRGLTVVADLELRPGARPGLLRFDGYVLPMPVP